MLEAARVQAERMVQRTEVVRAAEQRARQIMEAAEQRLAPAAPRDRGLPRPAPRQLRDPARQAAARPSPPAARSCRSATRRPAERRRRRRRPDQGLLRPGPMTVSSPTTCAADQRRRAAAPARQRRRHVELTVAARRRSTSTTRRVAGDDRRRGRPRVDDRRHRRRRHASRRRGAARAGAASTDVERRRRRRRRRAATSDPSPIRTRSRSTGDQIDLAPMVRELVLLDAARRAAVPGRLRRAVPRCAAPTATSAPCDCDDDRPRRRAGRRSTSSTRTEPEPSASSARGVICEQTFASAAARVPQPDLTREPTMAVPKKKKSKSKTPQPPRRRVEARRSGPQHVPALRQRQDAAHGVPVLRLVQEPRRRRRRLSQLTPAPDAADRGRRHGRRPCTRRDRRRRPTRPPPTASPIVLVGPADLGRVDVGDLPLIEASEVIEMDEDPASGVRRKKDSTLVRAAEAVRDGKASAMISAGNTGATMAVGAAADGPDQGRQPAGDRHADPGARLDARPCCSTPAPTPRCSPSGWCSSPRWARSTPATASASPSHASGCCRSARSRARATRCARRRSSCSRRRRGIDFIGNVEGRDMMTDDGRRRRHRRVHRQRRAEDARGRRAGDRQGAARRVRVDAGVQASTPTR